MKYAAKYTPLRECSLGSSLVQAQPILEYLNAATTEQDIRDGLARFADQYGITMSGHISVIAHAPHHTGHYTFSQHMESYTTDYLSQGLVRTDPVLWRAQKEVLPIPWGLEEHRKNLAAEEKPLYNLLHDYGVECGVLVPLHGPTGFSALGIAIDEDEVDFRKRVADFSKVALLVASHVHDAVRRCVGIPHSVTLPRLTPRERECLTWVAAGKTAWEIGQILHLAETTVVYYCENAKKKLESKSMPQAVARAISVGLISV